MIWTCMCTVKNQIKRTHGDGKGPTGFILSVGKTFSYLHARSSKQKEGTTSSTDAEVIAAKSCCQLI